jgi:hypothetical protein
VSGKLRKTMEEILLYGGEIKCNMKRSKKKFIRKIYSLKTILKTFMLQGMQKKKNLIRCNKRNVRRLGKSSINLLIIKEQWIKVDEYLKFVEIHDRKRDSFVGKTRNFDKPIKRAPSLWGGDTGFKSWRLRKVL